MRMQRAKALAAAAIDATRDRDDDARPLADLRARRPSPALARAARATCPRCRWSGRGIARTQPIWAEDVADCVLAALDGRPDGRTPLRAGRPGDADPARGRAARPRAPRGRRRRALPLPLAGLRAALRAEETLAGPTALLTWDEAQLLAVEMLTARGTADAEALGVRPRAMADVLH